MYGKRQSHWDCKSLEDILRGRSYTSEEHPLSRNDCQRVAHSLTLWFTTIHEVASWCGLERTYSFANLIRWSGQQSPDVAVLNKECKDCLAILRDFDPDMGPMTFKRYKRWLVARGEGNSVFHLLSSLFYRLWMDPNVFSWLNTICQFWTRLTLKDLEWLETDMVNSYKESEASMKTWYYPMPIMDLLADIIGEWFNDFDTCGCLPRFSNGATREVKRGAGTLQKVKRAKPMRFRQMAAQHLLGLTGDRLVRGGDLFPLEEEYVVWASVPKSVDKRRGISFEDTSTQYLQIAAFDAMDRHLQRHPEIRVNLHDQSLSQKLLLQRGRVWSTVDCSNASDTVTLTLVNHIFSKCPVLRDLVLFLRTPNVLLPDGTMLTMEKCFPMGSALCFPVESIVFASVARLACTLVGIPLDSYRVYGDDTVIDSRAYLMFIRLLQLLNFTVNEDKSFGPWHSFVEACGIEVWLGRDVTPCRLPRGFDIVELRKGRSPQQLLAAIELINRLGEYGLRQPRRYLLKELLAIYRDIPFSVHPELGVYDPNPCNDHLRSRRSTEYDHLDAGIPHDAQVLCVGLRTRHERSVLWEEQLIRGVNPRYELTLLQGAARQRRQDEMTNHHDGYVQRARRCSTTEPDLSLEVRCGPTRDSLRKEWVSLSSLLF